MYDVIKEFVQCATTSKNPARCAKPNKSYSISADANKTRSTCVIQFSVAYNKTKKAECNVC